MSHTELIATHDECLRLANELADCLRAERVALISLSTDEIIQQVFRKEALGSLLADKRRRYLELSARGGLSAEAESPMTAQWVRAWEEVKGLCEGNQRFTRHSLKNLGNFVDNLKRLLGEGSLYSAKGEKVESPAPGKVVEARY